MSLLAMTAQQAAMSFPEMSPAIFQIDLGFIGLGKFPIRWYALAYIGGLLIGWRYALALAKRQALSFWLRHRGVTALPLISMRPKPSDALFSSFRTANIHWYPKSHMALPSIFQTR